MAKRFALIKRVESGTYTPTLTNNTNLSASTASEFFYTRIGNIVHVAGEFTADPTSTGSTVLVISLPIPSMTGGDTSTIAGVAASGGVAGLSARVRASTSVGTDAAVVQWIAVDTANQTFSCTFSYRII